MHESCPSRFPAPFRRVLTVIAVIVLAAVIFLPSPSSPTQTAVSEAASRANGLPGLDTASDTGAPDGGEPMEDDGPDTGFAHLFVPIRNMGPDTGFLPDGLEGLTLPEPPDWSDAYETDPD